MVKSVLVSLSGSILVQIITDYFPCSSTSGGNKYSEEGCKQASITLVEGDGGAYNSTVRPIDPYTSDMLSSREVLLIESKEEYRENLAGRARIAERKRATGRDFEESLGSCAQVGTLIAWKASQGILQN